MAWGGVDDNFEDFRGRRGTGREGRSRGRRGSRGRTGQTRGVGLGKYRGKYDPLAHLVIFEDMTEKYDQIGFKEYLGECHSEHNCKSICEPYLLSVKRNGNAKDDSPAISPAFVKFQGLFDRQTASLKAELGISKPENIKCCARFGKFYTIDPPPNQMSLEEFDTVNGSLGTVTFKDKDFIKSSFTPCAVTDETALRYLEKLEFEQTSIEEEWGVMVQVADFPVVKLKS